MSWRPLLESLRFEIEQLETKLKDANDVALMEMEQRRRLELRLKALEKPQEPS